MRYKITERDNNKKLYIYGKEKDELFINGAAGLAAALFEDIDKKLKLIRGFEKIKLEEPNLSSLLEKFLNEILIRSKADSKVYPKAKILRFSDTSAEVHISGIRVEEFDIEAERLSIKEIKKDNGDFTAVFLFSSGNLL